MDIEVLQTVWFSLVGVLLGVFLVLGGIDFGACMLSLRSKKDADFAMKAIAPFWDANQVWLITAGGALFAAFPPAYSAVLSHLYTPVMLLLACLAIRVCAIEFYGVPETKSWRNACRIAAGVSALASMALIGIALGAIFTGKIFDRSGGFFAEFSALLVPSTLVFGAMAVVFSLAQGALFLEIARRINSGKPIARAACVLAFNSLAGLLLAATFCALSYPEIVPPRITISDSSGALTLKIMLGVAGAGVPLVLAYTIYSYRVFLRQN